MSYGPYSSREMHKFVRYGVDKKDGSRIVEKPSFVSFGDKDKPEPYRAGKVSLIGDLLNRLSCSNLSKLCDLIRFPNSMNFRTGGSTRSGSPRDTPRMPAMVFLVGHRPREPRKGNLLRRLNIQAGRKKPSSNTSINAVIGTQSDQRRSLSSPKMLRGEMSLA